MFRRSVGDTSKQPYFHLSACRRSSGAGIQSAIQGEWVFTRRIEDCAKPPAPGVSQAAPRVEVAPGGALQQLVGPEVGHEQGREAVGGATRTGPTREGGRRRGRTARPPRVSLAQTCSTPGGPRGETIRRRRPSVTRLDGFRVCWYNNPKRRRPQDLSPSTCATRYLGKGGIHSARICRTGPRQTQPREIASRDGAG